jgi:hypothetical protein
VPGLRGRAGAESGVMQEAGAGAGQEDGGAGTASAARRGQTLRPGGVDRICAPQDNGSGAAPPADSPDPPHRRRLRQLAKRSVSISGIVLAG